MLWHCVVGCFLGFGWVCGQSGQLSSSFVWCPCFAVCRVRCCRSPISPSSSRKCRTGMHRCTWVIILFNTSLSIILPYMQAMERACKRPIYSCLLTTGCPCCLIYSRCFRYAADRGKELIQCSGESVNHGKQIQGSGEQSYRFHQICILCSLYQTIYASQRW
jgi:hypothetical protein